MKVTGTDGKEVTAVITSTGFIISKDASPLSLPTTTSIGKKLWTYLRSAYSCT